MFDQQEYLPNFTSPSSNPNPEPINHPPMSDSYASPHPNAPELAIDTAVAARNGITTQTADSTPYEHAIGTLNEAKIPARSDGPLSAAVQHVANDVTPSTMQSGNIQSFSCKVCDVTCSNEGMFAAHNQGRRHLKNLQKQAISSTIGPKMLPPSVPSETCAGELENKKQVLIQNGASPASLIFCDICNVACNDEEVFSRHLAGKKHAAKVAKQDGGEQTQNVRPVCCEICNVNCSSSEVLNIHVSGKKHLKKLKSLGKHENSKEMTENPNPNPAEGKADIRDIKSIRCEICEISCNSDDLLKVHMSGKKHQKNLKKFEKPTGPNPAPATEPQIMGPGEEEGGNAVNSQRAKRPVAGQEDLEVKRQKVMENGVAADSVKTCTLCNVVCNSQLVFETHLAGRKHAQMVAKQLEPQPDGDEQA